MGLSVIRAAERPGAHLRRLRRRHAETAALYEIVRENHKMFHGPIDDGDLTHQNTRSCRLSSAPPSSVYRAWPLRTRAGDGRRRI
jgi:hypothetical protein